MKPFLQILAETIAEFGGVKWAGYFTADLNWPLEKEIPEVRGKSLNSVRPLHGESCAEFIDTRWLPFSVVQMKR